MLRLSDSYHRWIYLAGLGLVAAGLPLSKAFMSIGGIVLVVNFFVEGNLQNKWATLKSQPVLWLLIALYMLHVAGMLWTTDIDRGLLDLRVKLPLLLFPVVIPLTKQLSKKEFLAITGIFTASVLATSLLSTWEFVQIKDSPSSDFRSISLFTSHIRYSLMVCLAYLIVLNNAWNAGRSRLIKVICILLAIWLSVFIFILQSMTGIIVWFMCSYLLLLYTMSYLNKVIIRAVALTTLTVTPIIVGAYLLFQVDAFYPDESPNFAELETHTVGGEPYDHDTTNLTLENGNYINLYRAFHELEVEWNKRSEIPFWTGIDRSGQPIEATIMRYLTSKGLNKDSVGVNALTEDDIEAIESGVANVRFTFANPIDSRVYTVIWEIDRMINEKRVQGHSVTQRFVFWNTGWELFTENILFGVGTGDGNLAYGELYEKNGVRLSEGNRLRAHNQYLSFGVMFGIGGLVLFLMSIVAPFFLVPNANTFLYIGFSIVIYASMLNEDTLDTQSGVTLFAFFNMLFLYGFRGHSIASDNTER